MRTLSRRKAAMATFAGSGLSTVIAGLQSILLLPLYVKAVGMPTYGIWLATGEMLLWLVAFDCGLPNLMVQRISSDHAKEQHDRIGSIFVSGFLLLLGIASILGTLAWLIAPMVVRSFSAVDVHQAEIIDALRVSAASIVLVIVNYGFQGLGRALQRTALLNFAGVISTSLGFLITFLLIQQGYGLLAIAYGLLARSLGSLIGGLAFLLFDQACGPVRSGLHFSKTIASEMLVETPLQLTSGLAYAFMTNSQMALAAALVNPQAAVILGVTRKIGEFIKALLDMVGYATEGAFGHLFATGDREKSTAAQIQVDGILMGIGVTCLSGYIAINTSFIQLWMGSAYATGILLTITLAVGILASAYSYLGVTRLRAVGAFRIAAGLLLADCATRLGLMALGAWLGGLEGLCLGAILPPVAVGFASRRILANRLETPAPRFELYWLLPLFVASGLAVLWQPAHWVSLILWGLLANVISLAIFVPARLKAKAPRLSFFMRRTA